MDLATLVTYKKGTKNKRRVGRGESSGWGKTSGRGHKGLKSRSGGNVRPGFEGGQMPLYRKLPKLKGFKPLTPKDYVIVSLSSIEKLSEEVVDIEILKKNRIVPNSAKKIKVLASGELSRKCIIKADYYSKQAMELITKAGGTAEVIDGQ